MNAYAWVPILGNELPAPLPSNRRVIFGNTYFFDNYDYPSHIDAIVEKHDGPTIKLSIDIIGSLFKFKDVTEEQIIVDAVYSTYNNLKNNYLQLHNFP